MSVVHDRQLLGAVTGQVHLYVSGYCSEHLIRAHRRWRSARSAAPRRRPRTRSCATAGSRASSSINARSCHRTSTCIGVRLLLRAFDSRTSVSFARSRCPRIGQVWGQPRYMRSACVQNGPAFLRSPVIVSSLPSSFIAPRNIQYAPPCTSTSQTRIACTQ
jgi:hypothetical protein